MNEHNKIIVDVVGALARFAARCREVPGGAHFYKVACYKLTAIIWNLTENFTPDALTLMVTELDTASTMEDVMKIVEQTQRRGGGSGD